LGQRLQAAAQLGVDGEFKARTGMARLCRAWPVGGQFQGFMLLAQLSSPVVELTGLLTGFHPAALPQGVVTVMHGQRW